MAFWMPGELWNFSTREQAGYQGKAPIPLRFYVGGLDLVRGYVDSDVRTDRYAVTNNEVRFIAWQNRWLALMPAGFFDAGFALREDNTTRIMLSAGGGVRILLPWLVESGIRIDWAVPLRADACPATSCSGLSIGVYQFFDGVLTPERRD